MAKAREGRVRYDSDTDSFVYELLGEDGKWGMCMASKCVRREGAEGWEDTDYVHYSLLKKVLFDIEVYGVKVRLGR